MKEVERQSFIRGTKWFLLLLNIALVLAACTPAEPAPPGAIVDDQGRPVNIGSISQRIVSLAPFNTEILFALGLGEKVVGVDGIL